MEQMEFLCVFASNPMNYHHAKENGMTHFFEVENPVFTFNGKDVGFFGSYVLGSSQKIEDSDAYEIIGSALTSAI